MSPAPRKPRSAKAAAGTTTCPWCSAEVPAASATCPSCGASLHDDATGDIPGVTQIDPGAVSRASRIKPGRVATWLGAEATSESPELSGRVEPPSKEVRDEMLRLELAAIDAELEAAKASKAAAEFDVPPEDATEPKPG